jgi:hypothetical protein
MILGLVPLDEDYIVFFIGSTDLGGLGRFSVS